MQHLPSHYVERLVSELADHYSDFMEDTMRKDANVSQVTAPLGGADEVAAQAAYEYRHARFCGRHPILSLIVLPIVALPLLWAAALAAALFVGYLAGFESGRSVAPTTQAWAEWSLPGVTFATVLVPIVLAVAVCCKLASRAAVGWKWILGTSLLIAVLGSTAMFRMALPTLEQKGSLQVGFGVSTHPSLAQIVQFLLPLAIGAWTIWRHTSPPTDSRDMATI
jgi:hypothetical protein